jgi:hypothetical protein
MHRLVPPPAEPEPTPLPVPPPGPAEGSGVYSRERWEDALQQRRRQNQQAADIDLVLRELEAGSKDLLEHPADCWRHSQFRNHHRCPDSRAPTSQTAVCTVWCT